MNISPVSISLVQSQMLGSLTSSPVNVKLDDSFATMFSLLASNGTQLNRLPAVDLSSDLLSRLTQSSNINQSYNITSLSPAGFNMTLADPESAYKMMTSINKADVYYKTQFSKLSEMKSSISQMQEAGSSLGSIALSADNDSIKSRLQQFVGQYNTWIQRFDPDFQQGGGLAGTQAAQVSRFELEQNINNRFFGIKGGVHGLGEMGITIDPDTRLATLDTAKLDALLTTNKQGAVDTLQEFGANFAKSASLLNSDGNFILKRLDNLNSAIHYITDNKDSLQKEFGTGDTTKPVVQAARALAAYNQTYGT
ncbi:MAG: flagellar filament capping protein FliD [Gallionella sp.]|nr:flagellar filament capping protein FliD [Gallionella sp.]